MMIMRMRSTMMRITEVLIDGGGDVDENEVDNENDNSR